MSKPCINRPVPRMHVGKKRSQDDIDSFMKRKYNHLCKYIGKLESSHLFYTATDCISLLEYFLNDLQADGLRIYIASYSKAGSSHVPKDHDELLTLIFSPTQDIGTPGNPVYKDKGAYYIIFPGGSFDRIASLLDREIAREWILNYEEGKLRYVLNATFDDPAKKDTRSIHFESNLLFEFVEELKCQKATGLKAYFSADTDNKSKFYQQLLIQFVMTHRIGSDESDFYIEDQEGFDDRKKPGNLDTGNPCPPNFCAGADLP